MKSALSKELSPAAVINMFVAIKLLKSMEILYNKLNQIKLDKFLVENCENTASNRSPK